MALVMAVTFGMAVPRDHFPGKPISKLTQLQDMESAADSLGKSQPKSPPLQWFLNAWRDFQSFIQKQQQPQTSSQGQLMMQSISWMLFWTSSCVFGVCVLFCLHKQNNVSWWLRLFWITGFVAGGAYLIIWLQEILRYPKSMESYFAIITPVIWLVALGVAWRFAHRKYGLLPFARCAMDATLGAGCVVLPLGLSFYALDQWATSREVEADRRWAEIGMPLSVFDNGGMDRTENESLRQLLIDLQPFETFGVRSLYRNLSEPIEVLNDGERSEFDNALSEIIALLDVTKSKGDVVSLEGYKTDFLDENSDRFLKLYEGILSREPPRWKFTYNDAYFGGNPNWLALRKLALSIRADATRRYAKGDIEGAKKTVLAVHKLTAGMRENPLLVSGMIGVALEAMVASVEVYFPPFGVEKIAEEAVVARNCFFVTLQSEAQCLRELAKHEQANNQFALSHGLECLKEAFGWRLVRIKSAKYSVLAAEIVQLMKAPGFLDDPDLGAGRMMAITEGSNIAPNYTRAIQRTNATYIRKEQDEMIRLARARYYEGKLEPMEFKSLVIPRITWKVEIDGNAGSVTTEAIGVPDWMTSYSVAPMDFYSIPFDGSGSWKFVPKPGQ